MTTQSITNIRQDVQSISTDSKKNTDSEISLVLHTPIAQSLLTGSWAYKEMGLLQFAKLMQSLWQAAKEEDPYAEWYLMKTYEQINQLKEKIKEVELICQQKLSQLRGLEIQLFSNTQPKKIPLNFYTPFGYMAAYLIADMDYIFRQAFVLKRLGILLEATQTPAYFAQKTHELFAQARQWQYTGVTRKDIGENNQKAEKAKRIMGELPVPILRDEIQFMFLPKVGRKNKEQVLK